MKRKKLEWALETLQGFQTPNVTLEQYNTSAEIASTILHTVEYDVGLSGKTVADLGCGSGTFAIGAALLDASYCVGFDIDECALTISANNIKQMDLNTIDLVRADLTSTFLSGQRWQSSFDVVIMNPPFGTKKNEGMDIEFLRTALHLSSVVYSLHKSSTREHVLKKAKSLDANGNVLAELRFDLPATYKFHKRKSVDIEVDFIKFIRNPAK